MRRILLTLIAAAVIALACSGWPGGGGSTKPPAFVLSGGAQTVFDATAAAFSHPLPGLDSDEELVFAVGDSFFTRNWVTAPASTTARDGLGPLFNARACASCHFKDGRGRPPEPDEEATTGFLVRLSVPGAGAHGEPVPDPVYGGQVQDQAVDGVPTEGRIRIRHVERRGTFHDGTPYTLSEPRYELVDLAHGPTADGLMTSPRVAPHVVGMGLLEAVAEEDLLSRADPDDANGDGISGRANRVWDQASRSESLGRFGWKANQPSVAQQVAGAFLGDMGITTPLNPDENCTPAQRACAEAPHGGSPELDADDFGKVVFYTATLAVPARRDWDDPVVRRGEELFAEAGCVSCHVPELRTSTHPTIAALSDQVIRPYTDLLLHDMGEGLADGRPDFEADGREWRTPPLWGIGLFPLVNGHARLLHDGRARGVMEAVLWHGGEAEAARERVLAFDADEREALERFLLSL